MPEIKIDNSCLFEEIRRLNVYLNSDKLEQWGNQHAEVDKSGYSFHCWLQIAIFGNIFSFDYLVNTVIEDGERTVS
ncbi:hypothetical protein TNCV_749461 [Trichonephila clavipes]|nr:hypothetical protein TNCV_749461 [Trichonephila clavipes]